MCDVTSHHTHVSAAATAGPMRGGSDPQGAVIGRAGGFWQSRPMASHVSASRVLGFILVRRMRLSTQVDFRRMNAVRPGLSRGGEAGENFD